MKVLNICGKRGLGDLVATTAYILDQLTEDTHIIFNYPHGHGYVERFNFIMNEFIMPVGIKVTYEVNEDWSTVNILVANKKFGIENKNKTWVFSDKVGYGIYRPFKTTWKGDTSGPIGLVLNYKASGASTIPQRPARLFSTQINNLLESLIDNKRYYLIGGDVNEPLRDVVDKIAACKMLIGIDTSWAHIANCMRVPYMLCRNKLNLETIFLLYYDHPTLKVIEESELFNYLD